MAVKFGNKCKKSCSGDDADIDDGDDHDDHDANDDDDDGDHDDHHRGWRLSLEISAKYLALVMMMILMMVMMMETHALMQTILQQSCICNKCKKSCSGPGSVTTQAPAASQRMKLLQRLNQKLNFF